MSMRVNEQEAESYSRIDLDFRLVICARSIEPQAVEAWTARASHLEAIPHDPPYALLGWEERLYHHELARAEGQRPSNATLTAPLLLASCQR
jgi:hypothetical protein